MSHDLPPSQFEASLSIYVPMEVKGDAVRDLPAARLLFSAHIHPDGIPEILAATLTLQWPTACEASLGATQQELIFDAAKIVLACDREGRLSAIEATSFVPGPRSVPELIQFGKQRPFNRLLGCCLATIYANWALVETSLRTLATCDLGQQTLHRNWSTENAESLAGEQLWATATAG
jgi:hypothetical protein